MAVGWALVGGPRRPADLAKVRNLKNLALQASPQPPWAQAVQFTVHPDRTPLTNFWHDPPENTRHWNALVEIGGGVSKADLASIYQFIDQNCSHVDGFD